MYPPPQNYPPPSPFGAPQQPFAPTVPASATVLLICGVFKLLGAFLLFVIGALAFAGTAALRENAFSHGTSTNDPWVGLGSALGGGLGVAMFCLGAAVLVAGLLDAVGGHYARQGKNSGRIMGIISSVLGLIGAMGSLTSAMFAPSSFSNGANSSTLEDATSSFAVGNFSGGAFLFALNLYLLVSFIRNGDAFKR